MTNINKYTCRNSAKPLLLLTGIGLFLSSVSFSQTNSSGGMNDAKSDVSISKRDPFWPVGFVPEGTKTAQKVVVKKPTGSKDWSGAMKKVKINGVSSRSNNEFYAVINGEIKSINDTVSVTHDGQVYTWAVSSIKPPGSVQLRRVSAL